MNENQSAGPTGVLNDVVSWFEHPFTTSGSALNWVLFVGLLIVAVWFWQIILLDLTGR
jgi:hypothetical protein